MKEDSFCLSSCSFGSSKDFSFSRTLEFENDRASTREEVEENIFSGKPIEVQSFENKTFSDFPNFYICVTKGYNLSGCHMSSLFLQFRIHPQLPVIETPHVWCVNNDTDFRSGYNIKVESFFRQDFLSVQPTIELYKDVNHHKELLGLCILPLEIREKHHIEGHDIVFFYRNSNIEVLDLFSNNSIGSLVVSIGLGYPCHQKYLDPNQQHEYNNFIFSNRIKDKNENSATNQTKSDNLCPNNQDCHDKCKNNTENKSKKINSVNNSNIKSKSKPIPKRTPSSRARNKSKSSHRRRKHSSQGDQRGYIFGLPSSIADLALRIGFRPPLSEDDSYWKSKAREHGWRNSDDYHYSSIGISCYNEDFCFHVDNCVQTGDYIRETNLTSQHNFDCLVVEEEDNNHDESIEDQVDDLLSLLNQKEKKGHVINEEDIDFNHFQAISNHNEHLSLTPTLTLFDRSSHFCNNELSVSFEESINDLLSVSSEVRELLSNLPEIKTNQSFHSETKSLVGLSLSDFEEEMNSNSLIDEYSEELEPIKEQSKSNVLESVLLSDDIGDEYYDEYSEKESEAISYLPETDSYSEDIDSETEAVLKRIDPKLMQKFKD